MEKHDYASSCIYLITVTTEDRKRVLGSLVGDSANTATIEPTALGRYVAEAFRKIAATTTKKTGCRVQVLHYTIMPDHFHGIIYVRDTLPKDYSLGKIIAAWKSDCTHAFWNDSSFCAQYFSSEKPSLFARKFNDRILFRKEQLQTWIKYLDDNPRRLWLKMHFPDRLRKVYDFKAGKEGHQYTAVGNTFLGHDLTACLLPCAYRVPYSVSHNVFCYSASSWLPVLVGSTSSGLVVIILIRHILTTFMSGFIYCFFIFLDI